MWNVFKFFFVWFWLAVAAWVAWMVFAALTAPGGLNGPVGVGAPSGGVVATIAGWITGFFMCVPAYFLARPKRDSGYVDRLDS
jgi:hypothetical protein